jgi:hypothetical protein
LLAGGRRVVLQVDGKTHYTDDAGDPSPRRYAEMVRDDRELRLRGYEVYRFGGAELPDDAAAVALVGEFSSACSASNWPRFRPTQAVPLRHSNRPPPTPLARRRLESKLR